MTAAPRMSTTSTMRAASHAGIHDESPMMAKAPRAGIDQKSRKSAPTIHPDPIPASFDVRRSHPFAASISAVTRLRMSSGTSPRRVSRLSSVRSRKPRGVVMSRSAAAGAGAVVDRVVDDVLDGGGGGAGGRVDVVGGVLADLDRGIQPLTGGALGGRGLRHLDGAVPQCRRERHRAGLREVLHLSDLLLDRVHVPDLQRLRLDLLVPLAACARAEHIACCETDDESYFAFHGGSPHARGVLRAPRLVRHADSGIRP